MQDKKNHHQPRQPLQAPPALLTQVLGRIQRAEQIAQDRTQFSTAFTSPDWTWRVAAIEQLAFAEREVALPWLERALSDSHPSVRARAVYLLNQHQASELIQPSLHDPDWQVREIALLASGMQEASGFTEPAPGGIASAGNQPQHGPFCQSPLDTFYAGGKSFMKPFDPSSIQPFSRQNEGNLLHATGLQPDGLAPMQRREGSLRPDRRGRYFLTLVAAVLVSVLLIGGMGLVFTRVGNQQSPNTGPGAPAPTPTPTCSACDDNSNMADASLCAANKETPLNITRTFGTQKATFIRAYADTTQLMLVYIDGLASTDAVGFESVTIQQGIVLKGGSSIGGYSNPVTHQGYNVVSFATNAVPAGTTELHVQSIVDVFSGKSTPLNFTVPFHTDQKTVQVNQTATSKGISLTLKHVQFTGSAMIFYVGPEPYANGGYVSISVQSMSVNGQSLTYNGGQSGDNVNGNSLISIVLNAPLDQPGSWTVRISGDQQGLVGGWTWTFHFTVPT